jgi:hypothetical protein
MILPFAHGIHTDVALLGTPKEQISIGTSDYTFAMTANRPKKMLHIYNKLTFTIIIHIMLYTLSTNGITALGL